VKKPISVLRMFVAAVHDFNSFTTPHFEVSIFERYWNKRNELIGCLDEVNDLTIWVTKL
jgi:hypothetical protein